MQYYFFTILVGTWHSPHICRKGLKPRSRIHSLKATGGKNSQQECELVNCAPSPRPPALGHFMLFVRIDFQCGTALEKWGAGGGNEEGEVGRGGGAALIRHKTFLACR
jgi:hypothetical protein